MLEAISLFFGAFLDATIGPNLFVPGEPFLLAAGYQLHQGIIWGVIAVLIGGWLGDQLSYFIGKHSGSKAQRKLIRWQALKSLVQDPLEYTSPLRYLVPI